MFVLLMNWRSGPSERSFCNRWLDYLRPYLLSPNHFPDDVYIIEFWGAGLRSELQDQFHAGCERVLIEIAAAWNRFFIARKRLYPLLNAPKIIIDYCGDLVDENGMIALPRESKRGQWFVANNGIAEPTSNFWTMVAYKELKMVGANAEILIRDRRPKVLTRFISVHGYPKVAAWADNSGGFANGPYLSHSSSDPEVKYPLDEWHSENEVPIVETAEVIRAMDDDGFIPQLFIWSCNAADSAQAALEINSSMLVWGEIEGTVDVGDHEELCRLADELHSVTVYPPLDDPTAPAYLPSGEYAARFALSSFIPTD